MSVALHHFADFDLEDKQTWSLITLVESIIFCNQGFLMMLC